MASTKKDESIVMQAQRKNNQSVVMASTKTDESIVMQAQRKINQDTKMARFHKGRVIKNTVMATKRENNQSTVKATTKENESSYYDGKPKLRTLITTKSRGPGGRHTCQVKIVLLLPCVYTHSRLCNKGNVTTAQCLHSQSRQCLSLIHI